VLEVRGQRDVQRAAERLDVLTPDHDGRRYWAAVRGRDANPGSAARRRVLAGTRLRTGTCGRTGRGCAAAWVRRDERVDLDRVGGEPLLEGRHRRGGLRAGDPLVAPVRQQRIRRVEEPVHAVAYGLHRGDVALQRRRRRTHARHRAGRRGEEASAREPDRDAEGESPRPPRPASGSGSVGVTARQRSIRYTDSTWPVRPDPPRRALQANRAALVAAGERLFGEAGFNATSVEELAAAAGVITGALYHHFPTKKALFETVFEALHLRLLSAATAAGIGAADAVEQLTRGLEASLDALLDPDVQRIPVIDAPAVLGLDRYLELDERDAIIAALRTARDEGLRVDSPETLARLLLGALTRAGILIAQAADPVATRATISRRLRELLAGLTLGAPPVTALPR
jgi:AcrR family transcriptional regulator